MDALNHSEQVYQNCKKNIEANIDSKNCLSLWTQYENCFGDVKKTQDHLEILFRRDRQLQAQIGDVIDEPSEDIDDRSKSAAQKGFNESLKLNDAALF